MSVSSFDDGSSFGGAAGLPVDAHGGLTDAYLGHERDGDEDGPGTPGFDAGMSSAASPVVGRGGTEEDGRVDGSMPVIPLRGETRGRHKQEGLPPSRAREVQRAFRARRAAHLARLEDRIDFLERENNTFRSQLGLPLQQNTRDLGSGPTGRGKSLSEGGIPMAERVKAKKERERLRRVQEALAKGMPVPVGPPMEETNPAYLPGPSVGVKRKTSEVAEGRESSGGQGQGHASGSGAGSMAKKQKQGKKAAADGKSHKGKSAEPGSSVETYDLSQSPTIAFANRAAGSYASPLAGPSRQPAEMERSPSGSNFPENYMASFLAEASAGSSRVPSGQSGSHVVLEPPHAGMESFPDAVSYNEMLDRYGLHDDVQKSPGLARPESITPGPEEPTYYDDYMPVDDLMAPPAPAQSAMYPAAPPWGYSPPTSSHRAKPAATNESPYQMPAQAPLQSPPPFASPNRNDPLINFPPASSFDEPTPHFPVPQDPGAWPAIGAPNPFANMPPEQFQAMLAQAAQLITPDFSARASGAAGSSTPRTANTPSTYVLTPTSSTGPFHEPVRLPPAEPDPAGVRNAARQAAAKEEASKWPAPPAAPNGPDLLTRLRQCCHLSDAHVANDPGVLLFASRLCLAVNCEHGGKHQGAQRARQTDITYMIIEDAWHLLKEHLDPPVQEETPTTLSGFAAGMAKPRSDGQNQIATGRLAAEMVLRAARAKVGGGNASIGYWVQCVGAQGLVIRRELVIGLVGGFSGSGAQTSRANPQSEEGGAYQVDEGHSAEREATDSNSSHDSDTFLRNQTGISSPNGD